jgi:hypothetical protein
MPLGAVGWGVVAAGALGAGAAVYSSNQQSKAANNAANIQKDALATNQANLTPYVQQGNAAGTQLSTLMGTGGNPNAPGYGSLTHNFSAQDYLNNQDPGYQFQLQQGQQALQNSQAADSGALSGAALKGLIGYNQGMAATGYQNAYNRYVNNQNNQYSRLSGLMNLGENAAAGAGNTAATMTGNIGNTLTGGANAQAAGTVGAANAITGAVNNGSGYYMLNQMMGQNAGVPQSNGLTYNTANGGWTTTVPGSMGPTLPPG